MLRRLVKALFRQRGHASGGTLPPYRPDGDSVPAILSPGRYEVPPGTERRVPPAFLERLNAPRRR
ncbi:hypothetical protein GCM10010274_49450 [Streptomyces lavendofoliae]|uniref:Uncharacterized protein n=1 Tax=Streptomyces lavendofoliae TaxID=67314 RepID=A0A918M6P2_9ACTN|nr:hypothetical protein GCM10010274_49450 [Streptomyces lavendofoliae]